MAATEPPADKDGAPFRPAGYTTGTAGPQTETALGPPSGPPSPSSGEEPLTADLATTRPRVPTRALLVLVLVLAAVALASIVVALVILHQPHLTPLPIPSVSAIP